METIDNSPESTSIDKTGEHTQPDDWRGINHKNLHAARQKEKSRDKGKGLSAENVVDASDSSPLEPLSPDDNEMEKSRNTGSTVYRQVSFGLGDEDESSADSTFYKNHTHPGRQNSSDLEGERQTPQFHCISDDQMMEHIDEILPLFINRRNTDDSSSGAEPTEEVDSPVDFESEVILNNDVTGRNLKGEKSCFKLPYDDVNTILPLFVDQRANSDDDDVDISAILPLFVNQRANSDVATDGDDEREENALEAGNESQDEGAKVSRENNEKMTEKCTPTEEVMKLSTAKYLLLENTLGSDEKAREYENSDRNLVGKYSTESFEGPSFSLEDVAKITRLGSSDASDEYSNFSETFDDGEIGGENATKSAGGRSKLSGDVLWNFSSTEGNCTNSEGLNDILTAQVECMNISEDISSGKHEKVVLQEITEATEENTSNGNSLNIISTVEKEEEITSRNINEIKSPQKMDISEDRSLDNLGITGENHVIPEEIPKSTENIASGENSANVSSSFEESWTNSENSQESSTSQSKSVNTSQDLSSENEQDKIILQEITAPSESNTSDKNSTDISSNVEKQENIDSSKTDQVQFLEKMDISEEILPRKLVMAEEKEVIPKEVVELTENSTSGGSSTNISSILEESGINSDSSQESLTDQSQSVNTSQDLSSENQEDEEILQKMNKPSANHTSAWNFTNISSNFEKDEKMDTSEEFASNKISTTNAEKQVISNEIPNSQNDGLNRSDISSGKLSSDQNGLEKTSEVTNRVTPMKIPQEIFRDEQMEISLGSPSNIPSSNEEEKTMPKTTILPTKTAPGSPEFFPEEEDLSDFEDNEEKCQDSGSEFSLPPHLSSSNNKKREKSIMSAADIPLPSSSSSSDDEEDLPLNNKRKQNFEKSIMSAADFPLPPSSSSSDDEEEFPVNEKNRENFEKSNESASALSLMASPIITDDEDEYAPQEKTDKNREESNNSVLSSSLIDSLITDDDDDDDDEELVEIANRNAQDDPKRGDHSSNLDISDNLCASEISRAIRGQTSTPCIPMARKRKLEEVDDIQEDQTAKAPRLGGNKDDFAGNVVHSVEGVNDNAHEASTVLLNAMSIDEGNSPRKTAEGTMKNKNVHSIEAVNLNAHEASTVLLKSMSNCFTSDPAVTSKVAEVVDNGAEPMDISIVHQKSPETADSFATTSPDDSDSDVEQLSLSQRMKNPARIFNISDSPESPRRLSLDSKLRTKKKFRKRFFIKRPKSVPPDSPVKSPEHHRKTASVKKRVSAFKLSNPPRKSIDEIFANIKFPSKRRRSEVRDSSDEENDPHFQKFCSQKKKRKLYTPSNSLEEIVQLPDSASKYFEERLSRGDSGNSAASNTSVVTKSQSLFSSETLNALKEVVNQNKINSPSERTERSKIFPAPCPELKFLLGSDTSLISSTDSSNNSSCITEDSNTSLSVSTDFEGNQKELEENDEISYENSISGGETMEAMETDAGTSENVCAEKIYGASSVNEQICENATPIIENSSMNSERIDEAVPMETDEHLEPQTLQIPETSSEVLPEGLNQASNLVEEQQDESGIEKVTEEAARNEEKGDETCTPVPLSSESEVNHSEPAHRSQDDEIQLPIGDEQRVNSSVLPDNDVNDALSEPSAENTPEPQEPQMNESNGSEIIQQDEEICKAGPSGVVASAYEELGKNLDENDVQKPNVDGKDDNDSGSSSDEESPVDEVKNPNDENKCNSSSDGESSADEEVKNLEKQNNADSSSDSESSSDEDENLRRDNHLLSSTDSESSSDEDDNSENECTNPFAAEESSRFSYQSYSCDESIAGGPRPSSSRISEDSDYQSLDGLASNGRSKHKYAPKIMKPRPPKPRVRKPKPKEKEEEELTSDDEEETSADLFSMLPKSSGNNAIGKKTKEQAKETYKVMKTLVDEQTARPKPQDKMPDPDGFRSNIKLHPHQQHALAWMVWREKCSTPGGILADDMGLGKTIEAIALILKARQEDEEAKQETTRQYRMRGINKAPGGTLIVCPASVVNQWEGEITTKTNKRTLSVCKFHHNKEERPEVLADYDLVITTYDILKNNLNTCGVFANIHWRRIVLDEAHKIRNANTQISKAVVQLTADKRWALTGTPINNGKSDLFPIFRFLKLKAFDESRKYNRWIDNDNKLGTARLNRILDAIMLRRTKESYQAENPNSRMLSNKTVLVHKIQLSHAERSVYDRLMDESKQQLLVRLNNRNIPQNLLAKRGIVSQSYILTRIVKLRQICVHPCLIWKTLDPEMLQGIQADLNTLANSADNDDELRADQPIFNMATKSSKLAAVLDKIQEIMKTRDKLIIVSEFVQVLEVISWHLDHMPGGEHGFYTGKLSMSARDKILERFHKKDDFKILLLSLTAGGQGLNLMAANHVIIVDVHWNPQLEIQAQDRVYRIGQMKNVYIHKFICTDTIEERIVALQEMKLEIAKAALEGLGGANKLGDEELRFLFDVHK